MEDTIRFEQVKKVYRMGEYDIEALAGVDFTIKKGQFVIIAGASGAGKSTILNILGGMDTLTSGKVVVYGKDLSTFSQKEMVAYRRYDVGFVFQFYNLVQNLTAKENIELASQIGHNPLNVDEVIEGVGLSDRKKNFPSQLSGGEQQRVAIARALVNHPVILLADEATGNLDTRTSYEVMEIFQELNDQGITIGFVTHEEDIARFSKRTVVLKDGNITEDRKVTERLFATEELAKLPKPE